MKVSFITTIFNESETVGSFLNSLLNQSVSPDEIIIVDAGSTDRTVDQIKKYFLSTKIKWKVIIKSGNRSLGRNMAIRQAKGDIIVVSDAGCILDKNWLKNIVFPFKDRNIDVVAGFYLPKTNTDFEKCIATYTCVMPDKLDKKNFLPSSRSIAFRKSAWTALGGYPEDLDTCEDLVFAKRLIKKGFTFHTEDKAIVYWPQRKNIFEAFKQFYYYAKGDGQAKYIRPQTPLLYGRYMAGIILLLLGLIFHAVWMLFMLAIIFLSYLVWAIKKELPVL